jgi:crotonobetainyl-CoA:carnitine CoA-transferase CaiB-like acyl-CoA transferase
MTTPPGWPEPFDPDGAPAPLRGIRVLDLSRVLAGPLATMHLADLGATVLKVEQPGTGDVTRGWPPFTADGESTYYSAVNRNKRSLALDLGSPEDRAAVRDLAAGADVLVHNFLPGRLERWGLAPGELRAGNPQLVVATVTGFGSGSAHDGRSGFDFLAQAMGGVMAITGAPDGAPTRMGVAIVDIVTGLLVTQAVLAALVERATTGLGRVVEVSLLDSGVFTLMNLGSTHLLTGAPIARFGNAHPSIAPYETLPVADGEIAVAVGTDRQFARFAAAVGLAELAGDPRFAHNPDRVANRPALRAALEPVLRTRGRHEWLATLLAHDVPAAPVNEVAEVFADPDIRGRAVSTVDGVAQVRHPARIDGLPLPMHVRPPRLGEHTAETLSRLAGRAVPDR